MTPKDLAARIEALDGSDREIDAEIAIALHDGNRTHSDPCEHTTARKRGFCHGHKLGNYEVHGFSGASLRTAPLYTQSASRRKTIAAALRALTEQEKNL